MEKHQEPENNETLELEAELEMETIISNANPRNNDITKLSNRIARIEKISGQLLKNNRYFARLLWDLRYSNMMDALWFMFNTSILIILSLSSIWIVNQIGIAAKESEIYFEICDRTSCVIVTPFEKIEKN